MKPRLRARLGAYLYVTAAAALADKPITSEQIGARTGIEPTQVRRDLTALPRLVGRSGSGYQPRALAALIREALAGDATGAGALLIAAHAANPERSTTDNFLAVGVEAARGIERAIVA